MSNYTFVLTSPAAEPRAAEWVKSFGPNDDSDLVRLRLSDHAVLRIIARGATDGLFASSWFRGTAVDYRRRFVAFGARGLANLPEADRQETRDGVEGEYLYASWSDEKLQFSRDAFGNAALLYSCHRDFAIVSDSLLTATDFLSFMGTSPSLNETALLSRMIPNDVAGQQTGLDTMVDEVRYVPPPLTLECHHGPDGFRCATVGLDFERKFDESHGTYADNVRDRASSIAGLMSTLATSTDRRLTLSLSGGYDSRAVLNAVLAAGTADSFHFHTQSGSERQQPDYEVAQVLASRLGFVLNRPPTGRRSPRPATVSHTPLATWAASRLGLYDYLRVQRAAAPIDTPLGFTGLGAETVRGNYGWSSWRELAGRFTTDSEASHALDTQGSAALALLGVDPNRKGSAESHYLAFRNALHASAHVPLHMTGFTPLQQRDLVSLSRSSINAYPSPSASSHSIINDIAIVLHPEGAALPYAGENKVLSSEHVEDRLRRLGGQLGAGDIAPFHCYGSPSDVPAGASWLAIRIAQRRGLDFTLTRESVLRGGELGLDIVRQVSSKPAFERIHRNATWRLITKGRSVAGAGATPGKLFAVGALFSSLVELPSGSS